MSDAFDDKDSFRLDPQANSFHLKGFRWRSAPGFLAILALSVALLTGLNFITELGLSFLGRDAALFICGASLGLLAGLWIGGAQTPVRTTATGNEAQPPLPLSEHVRQLASDRSRKIEAIKAYRDETGASLSVAKQMVEAHLDRDAR